MRSIDTMMAEGKAKPKRRRAPTAPRGRIEDRFGRNVASARVHARLRQKELAKRAGIDTSYVSLIEAGKRVTSIALAEKIALALGVPLGTLLEADAPFERVKGPRCSPPFRRGT